MTIAQYWLEELDDRLEALSRDPIDEQEWYALSAERDAVVHRMQLAEMGRRWCRDAACPYCGKSGVEWTE